MASPFRLFRKYQKTLLVIAGVVLMFVFVIGDALTGYLRSSGDAGGQGTRAPNAVAVRWNGGKLTNAELDEMVFRRHLANALVASVEEAGRQPSIEAGIEPRPLSVEIIYGPQTPAQQVENSVVTTRILADLARQAGMRVSDEAIVQYLEELGRQNVSRDEMRNIIRRMQRASIDYVFNALREEMLARNYLASHQFALLTVTPEERWQDWLKLNDRIVLEAVPFPVEKYLLDVPEPTADELVQFFNEYKNREAQPDFYMNTELPSARPGFAIPRKIDAQFIRADYDRFLAKVENEITEAEIEKYYEENKDPLFIKVETGLMGDTLEDAEDPAQESGGAGESATNPADGDATAESETTEAPSATDGSAPAGAEEAETQSPLVSEETPQAIEDTQPATEENQPTSEETEPPADSEAEPSAEEEGASPAEGEKSSSRRTLRPAPFRLAAFLQEASDDVSAADDGPPAASDDAPSDAPVATDSSDGADGTTETPAAEDPTSEAPAAETGPAETAPAAEGGSPADDTPAAETAPAVTPDAGKAPSGEMPTTTEKVKEFEPLDDVRDQIREQLARERVTEQLIDLMAKLDTNLNSEFTKYYANSLGVPAKDGEMPAPPAALADLAPLAKEHELEYGTTGPMSVLEVRDTPLGKSFDAELQAPLWQILFGSKDLQIYQPVDAFDLEGNRYLAMKTSETPGRVPTLEEVRDEVAHAWKRQRAAELAKKYVEQEAKKIGDSGAPLVGSTESTVADASALAVIRTDPFSWLTGGAVSPVTRRQQPFRLSEPEGILAAGPQFMQYVFGLEDGQAGAALNNDQSIAYLVRVANHELSPDQLRAAYLSEANTWQGMRNMVTGRAEAASRTLLADIRADAEIQWERDPDVIEED